MEIKNQPPKSTETGIQTELVISNLSLLSIHKYLKGQEGAKIFCKIETPTGEVLEGFLSLNGRADYVLDQGVNTIFVGKILNLRETKIYLDPSFLQTFSLSQNPITEIQGRGLQRDAATLHYNLQQWLRGSVPDRNESFNFLDLPTSEKIKEFYEKLLEKYSWEKGFYLGSDKGQFYYMSLKGDPKIYQDKFFTREGSGFLSSYENSNSQNRIHRFISRDSAFNREILNYLIKKYQLECRPFNENEEVVLSARVSFESGYFPQFTQIIFDTFFKN